MRLYYLPASCSMSVHIAALEAGIDLEIAMVELHPDGTKTAGDRDYFEINPKGKVPLLEVAEGRLTETQVILQYVASLAPGRLPMPAEGFDRYRFLETLNFIASEIHRGFGPMWSPLIAPAHRADTVAAIGRAFGILERIIGDRGFVFGHHFTIADAYAFAITGWAPMFDMDLRQWPVLASWRERIGARPAVVQAMREEGLI
ncbi:glutathione binding-like protein [Lichenicoccus roseus]|uniref:Glutathione transferase GstA n=1 Tax=Lichenicoccus roseus TaxID=2683649 RepID=A0A5R9JCL7_9PROT|nr:glutathione binding-like protein [Lichenicoccus roseus]TLU72028.1 glutathione transferase GstA [Lichenicoccus roseus]